MKLHIPTIVLFGLLAACGNVHTPLTKNPNKPIVDLPLNPVDPGDDDPTTPPPAESPTQYCKRDSHGDFVRDLPLTGGGSGDTHWWAEGGTCLFMPLQKAWELTQDQDRVAWADVSGHDILEHEVRNNELFWLTKYWVKTLFITVRWNMEWHHTIYAGTTENPRTVLINYKKVDGTSHIPYWEGSIALERVTDEITSFTMRNQIHADRTNLDDAKGAIKDFRERVF